MLNNNTPEAAAAGQQNGCPDAKGLSDRLLEAMQTAVISFDARGIIHRTNSLAREDLLLTENPEGVRLHELISVIHDNRDILSELIGHIDGGEAKPVRLPPNTIVRCGPTKTQFFASGCITLMEGGCRLLSFRNIMDDMTREQILSMVLARTRIFPWYYDMERDKMLIDTHWFSYLGLPEGDCTMSQEEFFARVHPDEREMLAEALRLQLSSYEIQDTYYYRLLRGDGTWEWFSAQSMYLSKTDDGSPYRVVGVCQSIQDHKTIEENLRTARDKAQESERLKSAFLANMSHEIRTPLNAIVGFSNLLAGGEAEPGSPEAVEYSALIGKNCNLLLALVSDILDLSRVETGTMDYGFSKIAVGQFLSDIYRKYLDTMPQGLELILQPSPADISLETDPIRLRQVIDHLIGNAVKFTDKGHIAVGYSINSEGRSAELYVADTGRGIPADQTEKIFDRFYKLDSFIQGAGLGLSVCKTIIEGLGGEISVSSRTGEGSRFTLTLPLERRQDNLQQNAQE